MTEIAGGGNIRCIRALGVIDSNWDEVERKKFLYFDINI